VAFANGPAEDGFTPERIPEAGVHLDASDLTIDDIELSVAGTVSDASEAEFREETFDAVPNCPVSKPLAGPNVDGAAELH